MKLFPTTPSVLDAEQRLEQSKRQFRQQVDRAQSTLIGRSSLLVVTGVSALLGSWLARRKIVSLAGPLQGLLLAFLARFVLRRIKR